MDKIVLTDYSAFRQSLKKILGERLWAVCSKRESDIQRMWHRCLCTYALKYLHPPGRCHLMVELCAPNSSVALATWWDISLILSPPEEIPCIAALELPHVLTVTLEPPEPDVDDWPPPQKLFVPIPKNELGGCARSDSLIAPAI